MTAHHKCATRHLKNEYIQIYTHEEETDNIFNKLATQQAIKYGPHYIKPEYSKPIKIVNNSYSEQLLKTNYKINRQICQGFL